MNKRHLPYRHSNYHAGSFLIFINPQIPASQKNITFYYHTYLHFYKFV